MFRANRRPGSPHAKSGNGTTARPIVRRPATHRQRNTTPNGRNNARLPSRPARPCRRKTAHVTRDAVGAKLVARIGVEPYRRIRRIGVAARTDGGRQAPIPRKAQSGRRLGAVIEPADAAHRHIAVFVGEVVEKTGSADFVPRRREVARHPQLEGPARADETQFGAVAARQGRIIHRPVVVERLQKQILHVGHRGRRRRRDFEIAAR